MNFIDFQKQFFKSILLLLPLAAVFARAGEATEKFSIFGLALTSEIQFPSDTKSNIRGVSLSLFGEERNSVRGVDVGLCSWIDKEMTGIQISFVGSATKNFNGIQFAGLGAFNETFNGVMFAGLLNNSAGYQKSYGLQMAGLFNTHCSINFASKRFSDLFVGGQIAFIGNAAAKINGFQIALGINGTDELKGFQIGFYNYAETLCGLQIGVLNVAREGSGLQIGLLNFFGKDDNRFVLPLLNARF